MSILDRIILTLYMIFMVVFSICIIMIPFNLIPIETTNLVINELYSKWYYGVVGLAFFIISIKLFLSGISLGKNKSRSVIKQSELGEISISIATFESLSLKVVRQISGIKDVKITVNAVAGNLVITAKLLVMTDINIPHIVSEVQSKIKSYIENITEISVKDVKVTVDNVAPSSTLRVD